MKMKMLGAVLVALVAISLVSSLPSAHAYTGPSLSKKTKSKLICYGTMALYIGGGFAMVLFPPTAPIAAAWALASLFGGTALMVAKSPCQ